MHSTEITFLHRLRLLANEMLAHFDFELVRSSNTSARNGKLIPLDIGNFRLMIGSDNSLWREYQKNPEYTSQLGRLAACVFDAYPNGYLIDVGANIGDTAAMVRSRIKAPIICVEGDSSIFDLLVKNIAPMSEVTAHQCFLGERTETIQVRTIKDGWDTTLVPVTGEGSTTGKTVPIVSLDDFVDRLGMEKDCKLLKLDIEGFDLRALRGARRLLESDKPILLFEFNHENLTALGENGQDIFPYLGSLGYDQIFVYDGQGFFLFPTHTSNQALLEDLDAYARTLEGLYYYDICVFHAQDAALAERFLTDERAHRRTLIEGKTRLVQ